MLKQWKLPALAALIAFLGLCTEILLVYIEQKIYGVDISHFVDNQYIRHWQTTVLSWALVSGAVIMFSKRTGWANVFASYPIPSRLKFALAILLPLVISAAWSIANGGPGIVKFYRDHSLSMFIWQYIYYIFEMLLAGLIICFSQKAVDAVFSQPKQFPWGGVVLGLTWGLLHYFTKGSAAVTIIAFVLAIFFGIMFNWLGKDLRKTLPLMYMMFVCI